MPTKDYAITDYSEALLPPKLRDAAYKLSTETLSSVPTAGAGANAGTTPPAPVLSTDATDSRGYVTFGTGTTPAAGAQAVVTFGSNTAYSASPYIDLTPLNAATAALQLYVSAVSATGFTISCGVAPAASQANTVYAVNFYAKA